MASPGTPTLSSKGGGLARLLRARRGAAAPALLAALWLLHAAVNVWWLREDARPPTYDPAGHAVATLTLADKLAAGEVHDAARFLLVRPYPPLLYASAAPLAWLIGRTSDVLTLVQLLFLGVLLLSTYGIARDVSGPGAGLLAAAILSFYPGVYGLTRQFLVDPALTAMVALTLWLLVRARQFERPADALALGVALGLGLLAKTTFAQFVFVPVLIAAWGAWRRRAPRSLGNLGLAAVPALLMAGFWYWRNLGAQWRFVRFQTVAAAGEGDPWIWSLDSWLYYVNAAAAVQLMLPFVLAFLIGAGIVFVARRQGADPRVLLVAAWVVVPYVLLSLQPNKDPRYFMPALPALAILTAWGFTSLAGRWRVALLVPLLVWAAFQYVGLTLGRGDTPQAVSARPPIALHVGGRLHLVLYASEVHTVTPARRQEWRAAEILRSIRQRVPPGGADGSRPLRLVVIPDAPFFEPNVFAYQALADGLRDVTVERVTGVLRSENARATLMAADFVVAKTGDQGPAWTVQDAALLTAQLGDRESPLGRAFAPIAAYRLPDESVAVLYQRCPASGPRARSSSSD